MLMFGPLVWVGWPVSAKSQLQAKLCLLTEDRIIAQYFYAKCSEAF